MKIKKILFLVVTLFISINKVYSDELWRDYLEDGINNYETQVRYKWYKEQLDGEFFEYNQNVTGYKYKSIVPFYGEYTKWTSDCNTGYDIESKITNSYQNLKQIKYVKISNFSNFSESSLWGLLYYGTSTTMSYFDYQTACLDKSCVDENSYVIMELSKLYDVSEISIRLFLTNHSTTYTIELSDDSSFNNVVAKYEASGASNFPTPNKIDYNDYSWGDIIYTDENVKQKNNNKVYNNIEVCRYRPKYYYWFNYQRIYYSDDYLVNVPGYIKDENNYKVFYKYDSSYNEISDKLNYISLEKEIKTYEKIYLNNLLPAAKEKIKNQKKINKPSFKCSSKSLISSCNNSSNNDNKYLFLFIVIIFLILLKYILKKIRSFVEFH